jgi:hypothetical protein
VRCGLQNEAAVIFSFAKHGVSYQPSYYDLIGPLLHRGGEGRELYVGALSDLALPPLFVYTDPLPGG